MRAICTRGLTAAVTCNAKSEDEQRLFEGPAGEDAGATKETAPEIRVRFEFPMSWN